MYPTKTLSAVMLSICCLLFACKNESYPEKPEDVLTKYLETATRNKPEESRKYVTKNSGKILDILEKGNDPLDTVNRGSIKDMKIGNADIKGEKATVTSYNKVTNMLSYFILLKEDGKWKVNLNRETMIETTTLVLAHYGINIEDFKSGKITKDSAQKIMENYRRLHPHGE